MQLRHPVSRRDGAALPVALLAILVIGALVTGGFYSSSQESRISVSADLGSQAFYVAEYGLQDALGTWKNLKLEAVDSVAVDSAEALLDERPLSFHSTQRASVTSLAGIGWFVHRPSRSARQTPIFGSA